MGDEKKSGRVRAWKEKGSETNEGVKQTEVPYGPMTWCVDAVEPPKGTTNAKNTPALAFVPAAWPNDVHFCAGGGCSELVSRHS